MKNLKIKETYLLMLIVFGLVSLSLYTTYALFTASSEIENVVDFTANLTTDSSIIEYEMVTIPAGETKIIEVNITNSYTDTLYYGAWYEMVNPNKITEDIQIGIYKEKNSTPGSGTITSGSTLNILVAVSNNSDSDIMVNIGVAASKTEELNLSEDRIRITEEWSDALLVTDEVLGEYTTITTEEVNLEYSTPEMTELTLDPGTYLLEVWGAQGGQYNSTYGQGGLGGYSKGTLTLTDSTNVYVYVGGKGGYVTQSTSAYYATGASNNSGGFNGGANATYYGGGGGGASDIRIGQDSLYARVIVAGGGGGAQGRASATYKANGGVGGGLNGGNGTYYNGNTTTTYNGKGASISSGGAAGTYTSYPASAGTFGNGGVAGRFSSTTYRGSGAGGGGWYGGGGGAYRYAGGGGGSGWVYTEDNFNTWKTANSTDANQYSLDSKYYLTNASTTAGDQSFTDFDGSTVTGHSGDGAVRISGTERIVTYSIPRVTGLDDLYIKQGSSYDLASDVEVVCATGETDCSLVSVNITDISTLPKGNYTIYYTIQDHQGNKYKYARDLIIIHAIYEYTTPGKTELTLNKGTYLLEVWGAQGGSYDITYGNGGLGGYSKGIINLNSTTNIHVYVGGQGGFVQNTGNDYYTDGANNNSGGFNGGANASYYGGGGGGASDIRIITDGVTDDNSLYARVIVAGGGGGAQGKQGYYGHGGAGGGLTGGDGTYDAEYSDPTTDSTYVGKGATITSGGEAGYYPPKPASAGTFGFGGVAGNYKASTDGGPGAGGGGWYGGGGAAYMYAGGGGGSGWVYTEANFNTWQSGNSTDANQYLLNSTYYLTNAATIAGDQEFTDYDGSTVTGHLGNGAARITKID